MEIPADIDTATPAQVAEVLDTSEAGLAQMRYRGTGPKFTKVGKKVLYRWSEVRKYLEQNTLQRTDDPRGAGVA
jgi:Helix-turn-helix domain